MLKKCLYCAAEGNESFGPTALPSTEFRGKIFASVRCRLCGLVQLDPVLSRDDLLALYPPSYQGHGVKLTLAPNRQRSSPYGAHFSYARHFALLRQHAPTGPVLDFGCGDGNFVANAAGAGFACDGVEYDLAQVKLLREALPSSEFIAFGETPSRKYAAIRLSNVLEHLTEPRAQLAELSRFLLPNGIFLIEGPLEENANLAFFVRQLYFRLRNFVQPGRVVAHAPYHVSFSSARNQRGLFSSLGFQSCHFEVGEGEWPFPKSLSEAAGLPGLLKLILARTSMAVSTVFSDWGNAFLCVEKPGA